MTVTDKHISVSIVFLGMKIRLLEKFVFGFFLNSKIYIDDYVSQSCFHQQSVGCGINEAQGVSNYFYLVLPTCSRLITSLYFSMLDLQDDYKSI